VVVVRSRANRNFLQEEKTKTEKGEDDTQAAAVCHPVGPCQISDYSFYSGGMKKKEIKHKIIFLD
jgi:hypothetical protein